MEFFELFFTIPVQIWWFITSPLLTAIIGGVLAFLLAIYTFVWFGTLIEGEDTPHWVTVPVAFLFIWVGVTMLILGSGSPTNMYWS